METAEIAPQLGGHQNAFPESRRFGQIQEFETSILLSGDIVVRIRGPTPFVSLHLLQIYPATATVGGGCASTTSTRRVRCRTRQLYYHHYCRSYHDHVSEMVGEFCTSGDTGL
jgi:hypothetical protein